MAMIDISEVTAKTELGKTTIYRHVAEGKFPQPVKIGDKKVRWISEEIDAWLQSRIDARSKE